MQTDKDIIKRKNVRINTKAILFDGDLIDDVEDKEYKVIAQGEVTGYSSDPDDIDFHFEGVLESDAGKKMNISFRINDALTGAGLSTLEIRGDKAFLNGGLGTVTYRQIKDMIENHPEVKTIVFGSIIGSGNDSVNMHTGRLIREAGLSTMVLGDSNIASGGVDLFCALLQKVLK